MNALKSAFSRWQQVLIALTAVMVLGIVVVSTLSLVTGRDTRDTVHLQNAGNHRAVCVTRYSSAFQVALGRDVIDLGRLVVFAETHPRVIPSDQVADLTADTAALVHASTNYAMVASLCPLGRK